MGAGILVSALALLLADAAHARERPALDGPTQLDINRQAAARHRIADEALNHAYRQLMSSASPEGRNRLRAAQRAWITFRDLDCEARAGSRGGSFYPASWSLCLERLTDERTQALEDELNCEEGDLTCGGLR